MLKNNPAGKNFLMQFFANKIVLFNFLLSLIIALGFYWFPYISDDLMFIERAYANIDVLAPKLFSQPTPEIIADYFVSVDGRLANTVFMLLLYLPKFFFFLISWSALLILFQIGGKLASIKSFNANILYTLYVALCFPWTDQMYIGVFQSNYLWSCVGAVLLLYLLQHKKVNGIASFRACLKTNVNKKEHPIKQSGIYAFPIVYKIVKT
ncbi:MAG: hypothetical protein NC356_00730 [Ruminococcus sp.]|nr:hypothetical protein [Ruminococcus sp.]